MILKETTTLMGDDRRDRWMIGQRSIRTEPAVIFSSPQSAHVPSYWPRATLREIAELGRLPTGWDEADTPAISSEAIADAQRIILKLAQCVRNLSQPNVLPTIYGGVYIEWHKAAHSVTITINPDVDYVVYYCNDTDRGIEQEGTRFEREMFNTLLKHQTR